MNRLFGLIATVACFSLFFVSSPAHADGWERYEQYDWEEEFDDAWVILMEWPDGHPLFFYPHQAAKIACYRSGGRVIRATADFDLLEEEVPALFCIPRSEEAEDEYDSSGPPPKRIEQLIWRIQRRIDPPYRY